MSQESEWFEGKRFSLFHDDDEPRATITPYWVQGLVIVLLAAGLALATYKAYAEPRVQNSGECSLLSDMVLVAAALEHQAVDPEKRAGVMEEVYAQSLGGADGSRWRDLMQGAMRLARRDADKGIPPEMLANGFNQACNENRGKLDSIFGPSA